MILFALIIFSAFRISTLSNFRQRATAVQDGITLIQNQTIRTEINRRVKYLQADTILIRLPKNIILNSYHTSNLFEEVHYRWV